MDTTLLIYNIHGWTNGATDKQAASRTEDVLQAIFQDAELQPAGPMILTGDINGDETSFQSLIDCKKKGWISLNSQAQQWGHVANDYTCIAPNAKSPSIRDFVFCTPPGIQSRA